MKFKEIKPGMVIHCPTGETVKALYEHLEELGFVKIVYMLGQVKRCPYGSRDLLCYKIAADTSEKLTTYFCRLDSAKREGYTITEFSDLIESEPRFKVGDKVRVKKVDKTRMKSAPIARIAEIYEGTMFTISSVTECSDGVLYEGRENTYKWSEEMLEPVNDFNAPNTSSNALNNNSNTQMSAVEVLGWLKANRSTKTMADVFGSGYVSIPFEAYTPEEIINKIAAYEAAKKKPVEVEWVDVCRIIQIQDNGFKKCVYEVDLRDDVDPHVQTEENLKDYIAEHDGRYIAVVEDICRVKEDKWARLF